MKTISIILTVPVLCFAVIGCERIYPALEPLTEKTPDNHSGQVYLTVDKTIYSVDDTIRVTLHNQTDEPVFLEGCSALYIATEADTGWAMAPTVVCVWEGFALRIGSSSTYQEKYAAKYFPGVHRFSAPVYFECLDGEPISRAKCGRHDVIHSQEFTVLSQ